MFAALDANSDGSITHAEFLRGLRRHPRFAERLGGILALESYFFIHHFAL
jgi:hypothetical protein